MKEVLGSLPEVITAYKNYNLLVPTATDVQLNPFYKYNMMTNMENKDNMIARLEKELSTVQSKKTKAIEALAKLRLEKQKIAGESKGNEVVRAWAEAVVKAREVEFTDEVREKVRKIFTEMHKYYEQRYTPKVKTSKKCNACSLKDICIPVLNKKKSVSGYIDRIIAEEEKE